ncbi:MAG: hypothetical protein HC887_09030 [Desulfobacteraceae bacterium]|nr:hypothetical protein [Desulfobacteraceae bacterium]
MKKKLHLPYLPEFFPNYINIIQRRLLDDMRKFYLLPRFEQTRSFPDEEIYEKKLYILSVIYGSMSNQLGDMVLKNIDKWASQSDLPKPLIEDYIRKARCHGVRQFRMWEISRIRKPSLFPPTLSPG